MKGKEKRRLEIQELTLSGYSQEKIAEKLGVSLSTVSRDVKTTRDNSSEWLENLAQRDFANIYRETLEGFKQDLMYLNELIEDESVKNDKKLQLQIRREITETRSKYLDQLLRGPMVWSMAVFIKKYAPEPIEFPKMASLGGISGMN